MKYCAQTTIASTEISIAYDEVTSIKDIRHPQPHLVHKISIVHSGLQSLEGIEHYSSLRTLDLKYNNLEVPDDILRISNKRGLQQLNIQGNIIQHYSLCKYISLRKEGFTDLLLLNGQDYSRWGKNKRKAPSAVQLYCKMDKMEKSMQKTLKRVVRNNVMQKYRLAAGIEQEDEEETSRESSKHPTVSISSCERTPFRQISLSNANMIKSVKVDKEYPQQKLKINQLVIEPIGFGDQNQIIRLPLTQPTATFASQRDKQTMPFRGKSHYISEIRVSEVEEGDYLEEEGSEQDLQGISYITSHPTHTRRYYSNHNRSVMEQLMDYAEQAKFVIADGFYYKNLIQKVLKGLKPNNMPRRVAYI